MRFLIFYIVLGLFAAADDDVDDDTAAALLLWPCDYFILPVV